MTMVLDPPVFLSADPLSDPSHMVDPLVGSPIFHEVKQAQARRTRQTERKERRHVRLRNAARRLFHRYIPTPEDELKGKIAAILSPRAIELLGQMS